MQSAKRLVSIVIPCLNEEKVVAKCLDSLVESDYPKNALEVWVVDGLSQDRSREIVAEYSRRFPFIHLIDNPRRSQQTALNLGILQAQGEIIIRMDAHCAFSQNYIGECVRHLEEWGADNVGGRLITIPREDTTVGRAIAIAMSEVFGVGNSHFRIRRSEMDLRPQWVKNVPYACYRREVFDRIGLFNENLERSEDADFHRRMRKAGCKTLFVPSLVNTYYARSDLRSFCEHAFENGVWAILPTRYTCNLVVSLRHLVPLGLVSCLSLLAILSFSQLNLRPVLWILIGCYALANGMVSCWIVIRERDLKLLFWLPLVFALLHAGYGLGSIVGLAKVLLGRLLQGASQVKAERSSAVLEERPIRKAGLDPEVSKLPGVGQVNGRFPPGEGGTAGALVSVLMTVYRGNTSAEVERSLGSVVEQDYPFMEVVVVIDGAVDAGIHCMIDKISAQGDREFRVETFEVPVGRVEALNTAIRCAKGDFLALMDADDCSLPGRIRAQIDFLQANPEVDVVGCSIEEVFKSGRAQVATAPRTHQECMWEFRRRDPVKHATAVFRPSYFAKAGLYPAERCEDCALWLAGMKAGCRFANIPKVGYRIVMDDGFFSRTKDLKWVWPVFQIRLRIAREMGFRIRGYFWAVMRLGVMLLPVSLLLLAYRLRNTIWRIG